MSQYPEQILKNSSSNEGLLLGALFNDIMLFKEYNITEDLFISKEGRFYYGVIKALSEKGINTITDTDIRLLLSDDAIKQYKVMKGFDTIAKLKKTADANNIDSYIDNLQKRNYLMKKVDDGLDLTKEIEVQTKKGTIIKSRVELFEKFDCESIISFEQNRDETLVKLTNKSEINEAPSEIPESFLLHLQEGSEMGEMFDTVDIEGENVRLMPALSREVIGLSKKTLNVFAGIVNTGKSTVLGNIILAFASKGNKCLYISNELQVNDLWLNFLVYISTNVLKCHTITKKKLKTGDLSDNEMVMLNKAREIYNNTFGDKLYIVTMNDMNMPQIEKVIRKYSLTKSIDCVCVDTFKADFVNEDNDQSYQDLIRDSRRLDALTKKYDLIGLMTVQISQTFNGSLIMDISQLAGAKAINEVLSTMFMMRSVFPTELDPESKYYIQPFIRQTNEFGEWEEKEFPLDYKGTYRVVFITKSRTSSTFADTNTAYIVNFNGKTGTVKEICLCRPKRGNLMQNFR